MHALYVHAGKHAHMKPVPVYRYKQMVVSMCVAMAAVLFPFLGWLHRGHLLKERSLSAYDLALAPHTATDLQDMGQGAS